VIRIGPSRRLPVRAVALSALLMLVACGRQGRGPDWTRSLPAAKAKAASGHRLIIADIYTDWCGWCKKMDATTWAHPGVVQERDKYVFLKLNAETEPDGIELSRRYRVDSYPTVLLLEPDGNEFDRLEGYMAGEQFLSRLSQKIADPESLGNLRAREKSAPDDLSARFGLGKKLLKRSMYGEARPRFEKVLEADPENESGLADTSLFYAALCRASEREFDAALADIARLRSRFPNSEVAGDAYLLSSEILTKIGRRAQARTQIEDFLKSFPKHRLIPQARKLLTEL
jgi:thioredoxin-like negative regulator of GroEL